MLPARRTQLLRILAGHDQLSGTLASLQSIQFVAEDSRRLVDASAELHDIVLQVTCELRRGAVEGEQTCG